jgi:hypothetical protein
MLKAISPDSKCIVAGAGPFARSRPWYKRHIAPGEWPAFTVKDTQPRAPPPATPVED